MICSGCLRDVPDLVGPDEELCLECYGLAAEDFVPSHAAAWDGEEPNAGGAAFGAFAEDFAAFLAQLDALDLEPEAFRPGGGPGDLPTFQGKRRF